MPRSLRIGTKLFLSFVIIAGAAILATGLLSYLAVRDRSEAQVRGGLALMARIEASYLLEYLDNIQNRAVDFATDRYLIQQAAGLAQNADADVAELNAYLRETKQPLDDAIIGINIIGIDGSILASSQPELIGRDLSDRQYFTGASGLDFGNVFLHDVFFPGLFEVDEAAFVAAAPLIDEGEKVGVIANYYALSELKGILTGARAEAMDANFPRVEGNGYPRFYIVNQQGFVITGSEFAEDPPLQRQINTDPVLHCIHNTTPFRGRYSDYRGVTVIGAGVCMQNGWVLIAELEEQYAYAGLEEIRRSILIATLVMLLVTIGFAYLIAQQLRRPLNDLTEMAKRLSSGDFSLPVKVASSDEVGTLGTFMNEMAERLKGMYKTMGDKIQTQGEDLQKFELAVKRSSDHIVITDPEGVILYANPAVEKITGFSPKEVIGKKAGGKELWGGHMESAEYEEFWNTIKRKKETYQGEFLNQRKDGSTYHAEAKVDPILDDEGNILYFVGVERDITAAKELEQMRSDFITIVSHQLRTPLGSIRWMAEMLLNGDMGKLQPEAKQGVEQIYRGIKRLLQLVQSLLSVSRIDRQTYHREMQATDLAELITKAIDDISIFAEDKKVRVQPSLPKGKHAIATVHPTLFKEIMDNLISNAVKYNYPGGEVKIGLEVSGDDIIIRVADNGIGIPAQDHDKVFFKFYRSENAQLHETNGTGLGLFIVKSHVEGWGGSIDFESKEGEGTTFTIHLPREQAVAEPPPEHSD